MDNIVNKFKQIAIYVLGALIIFAVGFALGYYKAPPKVKTITQIKTEVKEAPSLPIEEKTNTHVDFMIGTSDLSIIGTTKDGREVPVFVNGSFAL